MKLRIKFLSSSVVARSAATKQSSQRGGLLRPFGARNDRMVMSIAAILLLVVLSGCDMLDMYDQHKFKTYGRTEFFSDHRQSRPLVDGVVARGQLRTDDFLYAGTVNGKPAETYPFPIVKADLIRGRERFNIYCSPCHGQTGVGNGMIVQRGYTKPTSYHSADMRAKPIGHFFQVITQGFGSMPSYAAQVDVEDRWRIAAYIRVLQLSQNVAANSLPATLREKLDTPVAAPTQSEEGAHE
jgi:mono/diheme cytochrome c family protein